MPFASKAQAAYLHMHPEKVGGEKALKEWDDATDFSHLPKHTHIEHHEDGSHTVHHEHHDGTHTSYAVANDEELHKHIKDHGEKHGK